MLVWIHGGGFTIGNGAMYDGAALAAAGDVVVVTINYRLGVFGFLDVGRLSGDDVPSNLGLRDQIAALQWVQDNIAGFGGDPRRVTVAGESAGAVSIALLLTAPAAAGLFRSAIMQSGSHTLAHGSRTHAAVTEAYARELGSEISGPAGRTRIPAAGCRPLSGRSTGAMPGIVPTAPWFDGDLVAASAAQAGERPPPDVALLAGHNRDEITLFRYLRWKIVPSTRRELAARLADELGPDAGRVLDQYPDTRRGNLALASDLVFALPTRHFAERHAAAGRPTYCYRFDPGRPLVGAMHASELPYVRGWQGAAGIVLAGRETPARRALAERMRRHWLDFVTRGRPGDGWSPFALPDRRTMILDTGGDRMEPDPDGVRRAAWGGRDVPIGG